MLGWVLRFLLVLVLVRIVWRFFAGLLDGVAGDAAPRRPRVQPSGPMPLVRDPQCGVHVARERAIRVVVDDQVHYFCSEACRDTFVRLQGRR